MTMPNPKAFNREKFKTRDEFWKAFDQLCDLTPSEDTTCKRIRDNQELFIEYQQKCLNKYDPTLQQAIEHAGDIIRELSKCGFDPPTCHLVYVEEKLDRLRKRIDDLAQEKGLLK